LERQILSSHTVRQLDIWLADLDQVDEDLFTNLSGTPGEEAHPVWSPDGRRLAWGSVMEGFHNLYLWDSQSAEMPPHVVGGGDWPVFNPDGTTLLAGLYTPNRQYLTVYGRETMGWYCRRWRFARHHKAGLRWKRGQVPGSIHTNRRVRDPGSLWCNWNRLERYVPAGSRAPDVQARSLTCMTRG
jgi:hypothetical protein